MIRVLTHLSVLALLALGCDNGVVVLNAAPNVTAVGPVTLSGDTVEAWVWIRDHERNAADLELAIVSGGAKTPVIEASTNGLTGLTTVRESSGEPHRVTFAAGALTGASKLKLVLTATDVDGGPGPTFESAEFTLSEGLPTP